MKKEIFRWGEKFIVLLVVFLLILPADLPAKKKKGAQLKVTKKDGEIINGELIQVKQKSLLLITNSETGATIDINEIRKIRIKKKSKALIGALLGSYIGIISGALYYGYSVYEEDSGFNLGGRGLYLIGGGFIGWLPGTLLGVIVGTIAVTDKKILVEGKSQEEKDSILIKLKKKARIK